MTAAAPFGLTRRQAEALVIIRRCAARDGFAPTIRELGAELGLKSPEGVSRILHDLRRRGHVDWLPGKARSLRLTAGASIGLPDHLASRLDRYCAETGDRPADVIADAVALHLDEVAA